VPLLSLQNSYNAQDLVDLDAFIDRQLQKTQEQPNTAEKLIYSYIIEPKFDGISVELIYKD
jgi:NAD-dependent DNA ligase